jgi:hypothetical protein
MLVDRAHRSRVCAGMSFRFAGLVCVVAACASSPPASHLFPPGAGECTDPKGCEAPVEDKPRFESPDSERTTPPEGAAAKPDTSCRGVGDAAASFVVGNYADRADRDAAAAKYAAACTKHKLDLAARTCVVDASNLPSLAYCAPALVPEQPVNLVERSSCAVTVADIHQRMIEAGVDNKPTLESLGRSCEQDRWTAEFAGCARQQPFAGIRGCFQFAPDALAHKVEVRLNVR